MLGVCVVLGPGPSYPLSALCDVLGSCLKSTVEVCDTPGQSEAREVEDDMPVGQEETAELQRPSHSVNESMMRSVRGVGKPDVAAFRVTSCCRRMRWSSHHTRLSPFLVLAGRRSCRAHGSRQTEEEHNGAAECFRHDSEVRQGRHRRIRRTSERIRRTSEEETEETYTNGDGAE